MVAKAEQERRVAIISAEGMCDNCSFSSEAKEMDVSGHTKVMLSLLQDMQENDQRITMLQLVDKMKVKHKDAGPEIQRDELEQLVIQLIVDRVLKEEFQHTAYSTNSYVTIGPLAKQVLQGCRCSFYCRTLDSAMDSKDHSAGYRAS
ncbi:hypothetical protein HYC85_008882 [Camellia sinensis]|uniref:Uncharacterized protein n=1 Tax=Camellia sinensis TaxID=4442 RepID=A0A7J7HVD1_CAMSI|nr:hypothetical protein HYC85_008882 [Camellia sinensis]